MEVLEISGSLQSFQDDVCDADTDLLLANGRFNASGAFQKDLSQDMEVLNLNFLILFLSSLPSPPLLSLLLYLCGYVVGLLMESKPVCRFPIHFRLLMESLHSSFLSI